MITNMTKRIIILLTAIAFSFGAYAQESFRAYLNAVATDGIVRGDELSLQVVSYSKFNGMGRFMVSDATGLHDYHPVDPSWDILDFRIVGDTVVFCGTVTDPNLQNTEGLIGYFLLSELYGSVPVNYRAMKDVTVYRFNKVGTYRGAKCLYAIGEHEVYTPVIDNGVVVGYYTGHATCVYIVENWWNIPTPSSQDVHKYSIQGFDLTDLSVSDDVVVAVGDSVGNNAYTGLYLARFAGSSTVGDEYYYGMPDEPLSDYHSIGINDKQVVVACLAGGPSVFSTNIHVVDLTTMDIVNSQQFALEDKAEPSELAFLSTDKLVVLQQYMALPSNPTSYESLHVRIEPNAAVPYPSYGFYHRGSYHVSVGSTIGKYAIGFNGKQWLAKDLTLPVTNHCYDTEPIDVLLIDKVSKTKVNKLTLSNPHFLQDQGGFNPEPSSCSSDCMNP